MAEKAKKRKKQLNNSKAKNVQDLQDHQKKTTTNLKS